jgi:hypothetical protein
MKQVIDFKLNKPYKKNSNRGPKENNSSFLLYKEVVLTLIRVLRSV